MVTPLPSEALAPGPRPTFVGSVDSEMVGESVRRNVPHELGAVESIVSTVPALISNTVDITSASLGLTERGDINDAVLADMPGVHNFLKQNQFAFDGVSGVAELVVTSFAAGRIFKSGTAINAAVRAIPGVGNRIAALDMTRKTALARVAKLDQAIAGQKGLTGSEAFLADAVIFGIRTPTRNKVANVARRASFTKNAVEGAAIEAQLGIIANENDFLYFEEASTNIALATLGIAIPGAIGVMGANFEMRRFANSDALNRIAFEATDHGGFDRIIEAPLGYIDSRTGGIVLPGEKGAGITTNGANTDLATAHFLSRSAKQFGQVPEGAGAPTLELVAVKTRSGNQNEEIGFKLLERVAQKGAPGVAGSAGKLQGELNARAIQHVKALTRVDDTAFLGVEHISFLGEGMDAVTATKAFNKKMGQVEASAQKVLDNPKSTIEEITNAQSLMKTVRFNRELEPMVARNMEMVPVEEAMAAGPSFQGRVSSETTEGLSIWSVEGRTKNKALAMGDDGQMILPVGVKDPSDLALQETQGLFRAADRALDVMAKRSKARLAVRKGANWLELDFAEELARRTGGKAEIMYPQSMTRETAMVESLAQKTDIIKKRTGTGELTRIGLSSENLILREQLNLPRLKSWERGASGKDRTSLDHLIQGATSGQDIRRLKTAEIKKTLSEFREATDLIKFSADEVDLLGSSFKLGLDQAKGGHNEIAEFLVFKRPIGKTFFTRDFLESRLANRQADLYATLIDGQAGPITSRISKAILSTADYQAAVKSGDLAEIQLQGGLPMRGNSATQTSLQFGDFAFRDSPVLTSALRIQDLARRESAAAFEGAVTAPIAQLGGRSASQVWASLRNKKNLASSQLFDQFISARRGWQLSGKTRQTPEGFTEFMLLNNDANRTQWERFFPGIDMPKDATMPFAALKQDKIQTVMVDQLALDGIESFQALARQIRQENNTVLRANGFGELSETAFYVPSRDFSNQFINFVMDTNGKVVQVISAKTEAELSRTMRVLESDKKSLVGSGRFSVMSQDTIEEFSSVWERAHNGLQDANVPVIQVGKQNTGASLSPLIEANAWESSIRQFQSQYTRLGKDITETLFKNQLRAAKGRASVARLNKKNKFAGVEIQRRNIHDIYSNVLLGRNPLNEKGSSVGRAYNLVEALIDDKLVKFDRVWQNVNPFTGDARAARQYEELVKTIDDKMPFEDVTEFLAQRTGTRTPTTIRKLTGQMNKVTAGLILRWGDVAHPILNITGMINTAPAVIRQFTQRPGESFAQYSRRVGPYANVFRLADGKAVGTLDIMKVMNRAMTQTFKGEAGHSAEMWKYIKDNGFMDQEVAEFYKQLGSITKSEAGYQKFFDGADRWVGMMSDKSEQFARSYFHNVGLDIGEMIGIKGTENLNLFAHDLANRGIANYNPLNRPEIFQGGIGAPLGLFQSYMWNYLQRTFRYLETGDLRTLGTQMAMQGTMFGMITIPGVKQFNELVFSVSDGDTNPFDGVYQNFDQQTADVLMHGIPSSMPKMFGAPDGVALSSRGDASPRIPVAQGIPITQIAAGVFEGINQGIGMFQKGSPGATDHQLAEILGNAMPNRPLSGLLDIYVGADTDVRGQTVSRQVSTTMGATARLLGLKTLSEAKESEALFRNKAQNTIQLNQRERLLRATRSAVRAGDLDALPRIASEYLQNGGEPADLKGWMREAFMSASLTRNERQLLQVMNDKDKMGQLRRLIDAEGIE